MSEVAKRIYIGSGAKGEKRKRDIEKLADEHFRGNVSALFNDAVDRVYGLGTETGGGGRHKKNDSENFLLNDRKRS